MRQILVRNLLRPWWRFSRGLTLGVRGVVPDGEGRVLLVRHSYVAGWHLPGGGVERGETLRVALERELREEAAIVLDQPPRLHWVFSNEEEFPGDHVAVFVAESWRREDRRIRGAEIAEVDFFALDALPEATTPGTRRRLAEIFRGTAVGDDW